VAIPAGNLSVNPIPDSDAQLLGFLIVKLREVVPLTGMVAAPNALVMVGGSRSQANPGDRQAIHVSAANNKRGH
jgi:hypothetical protein